MGDFFGLIWTKILDFGAGIRDLFANFLDDFRESNRYFKVKVGLVSAYVVLCLATVVVFVPPSELNEIGARVRTSRTEIVGGRYFLVVNEGSDVWKNIILTFNDSYLSKYLVLKPGKKKAFFFHSFKNSAGKPPPENIRVKKLRIDCSAGSFERDFIKKR